MFRSDKLIRFHHCDPAAIVFYPQYFVLFHELVEDWFADGLGIDYAEFISVHGVGLPMAKIECEFLAPSRMGDMLSLDLSVLRIGTTSIVLRVRGSVGDQQKVRATLHLVHVSLASLRPVPVPPELRAGMMRFCASNAAT
jgi:4-hydroxybenzoyl-CoA thioesterase